VLEDGDLAAARKLLRQLGENAPLGAADGSKAYGTSEQRLHWYDRGLAGTGMGECDTLDGIRL